MRIKGRNTQGQSFGTAKNLILRNSAEYCYIPKQAFTGKDVIRDNIWDDEDGWQDIGGPVLCAVYHNFQKETVEEKIRALYTDAPRDVLAYILVQQLLNDGYLGIF